MYTDNYQVTGSHKVNIKQTGNEIITKEKTSFVDPVTGASEKKVIKTKAERSRSRSRSSSDEKRRRNMNMPVAGSYPANTTYPVNQGVNYPVNNAQYPINTGANYGGNYPMNNAPVYTDSTYQQQQPINPALYNNVANNAPMYNAGYVNTTNPLEGAVAHEKGKLVQRGDMTKQKEELTYINPVTGFEENAKIKTKVRGGDRSRSRSIGKSKTAYDHKTMETADGQKTVIKEKHREGGVMQNIKNKINNIMHR